MRLHTGVISIKTFYKLFLSTHTRTQRHFTGVVVTEEKIQEAKEVYDAHLGPGLFNYDGWMYVLKKHNGRLPLRIKAVPEGTVVPTKNGNPNNFSELF